MTEQFDAKAARKKRPMPIWVDAFVRDTMSLDAEQIGAYNLLLWAMWSNRELCLPHDMKKLAVVCRVSPTRFKRHIWPELEVFFDVAEGQVSQKRLKKEAEFVEQNSSTQSEKKRGKISAKPLENNKGAQSADNQGKINGSPKEVTRDNPTQLPNKDNNSEDNKLSSSSLSARDAHNDDDYQKFLEAHPKPRETTRGEEAWTEAIASGTTAEDLIRAARRYATVSKTYDRDKIKFSDNWLAERSFEKYPAGGEKAQASEAEVLQFWANKIRDGRAFGLSESMAHDCIEAGLVTQDEVSAVMG